MDATPQLAQKKEGNALLSLRPTKRNYRRLVFFLATFFFAFFLVTFFLVTFFFVTFFRETFFFDAFLLAFFLAFFFGAFFAALRTASSNWLGPPPCEWRTWASSW